MASQGGSCDEDEDRVRSRRHKIKSDSQHLKIIVFWIFEILADSITFWSLIKELTKIEPLKLVCNKFEHNDHIQEFKSCLVIEEKINK